MSDLVWEPAGEHLVSARAGNVAVLRFDRPTKLNALTPTMVPAIAERIRTLTKTSAGLVLTGTGRAFSAGDDLDATADLNREGFEAWRFDVPGLNEVTCPMSATTAVSR